jgi:hypothetical protein
VETAVTLSGVAAKGQKVEIFDGAVSKGQATAHATTGVWTLLISALTLAAHSFTAKALYGSGATSAARTLTVTAATAPTLTSVKGSPSGVEIPQGGSTVETAVTLSGVAAKGQKVEIFDGAVSKGQATAHATTGVWTLLISALAVAAHSFTAKALYGSGATSAARTLTVVQNIVPELRLITDSALVEIPDNGQTIHTTIILSGIAGPGTVIDLVNYGAPLPNTNIQVDAKGTWTFQLTGLSVGTTYNLRARRKGGSVSNARNVVVVAAVVATLDNVLDDKGVEVPQNQTTVSTTLKLKGTASPGQKVEIFDGNGASAVSKGVATAHATTSIWEHSITVALGARRLYAKALYAVNPVFSNVRNLTVTAATAPTLTSVKGSPSGVEIPQGGSTVETAVTLSGVAAKGQKVEIFDGAVSKGQATAHATTGVWTLLVSALAVAAHSFTAKALYGAGADSEARLLFVVETLYESFNTFPPRLYSTAGQFQTPNFTVNAIQQTDQIAWGIQVADGDYLFPGKVDGNFFILNNGRYEFIFNKICYRVSFWYSHVDNDNHRVEAFNEAGILLETKKLQRNRGIKADQIAFNLNDIKKIIIITTTSEALAFDNFEFTTL